MRGSTSRWSVSAITNSCVLRLAGRTAAATSLSSGTNVAGGSPPNRPGTWDRTRAPARPASDAHSRLGHAPPPRAAIPSSRRTCRREPGSRPARDGGGQLEYERAAPGQPGKVNAAERQRLDHGCEAVRIVAEAESRRDVRGAACPGLVPGNDGELVGQRIELRLPDATIVAGAVHEHERRTPAALVGDLEPGRPNDLHCAVVTDVAARAVGALPRSRAVRVRPARYPVHIAVGVAAASDTHPEA